MHRFRICFIETHGSVLMNGFSFFNKDPNRKGGETQIRDLNVRGTGGRNGIKTDLNSVVPCLPTLSPPILIFYFLLGYRSYCRSTGSRLDRTVETPVSDPCTPPRDSILMFSELLSLKCGSWFLFRLFLILDDTLIHTLLSLCYNEIKTLESYRYIGKYEKILK